MNSSVKLSISPTYYALAIFFSSFLIFLVQPLVGKFILPWYGGGSGVWTVCLLFFQVMLVFGYAYAHLLTSRFTTPRQVIIHITILALSFLFLPMIPSQKWWWGDLQDPTISILLLLVGTVGFLYFFLASSAPLLQKWFAISFPTNNPYRLYAVSNIASLSALLAYPILFEKYLDLKQQCHFWSYTYLVYSALIGLCAVLLYRHLKKNNTSLVRETSGGGLEKTASDDSEIQAGSSEPTLVIDKILWVVLSAFGSIVLMSTTNQITQDIAPMPFLWVLPLGLYLLTFIICFDRPEWYKRDLYTWMFIGSILVVKISPAFLLKIHLYWQILIYAFHLFVACMCCHGELILRRPPAKELTRFYLSIAIGGAIGGCLVAIVAPIVFTDFHEGFFAIILLCVLFILCRRTEWLESLIAKYSLLYVIVIGSLVTIIFCWLALFPYNIKNSDMTSNRNFYGVIRIVKAEADIPSRGRTSMFHGTTLHGFQFLNETMSRIPTSYFHVDSGIGKAIQQHPKRKTGQPMKIGVIGLGVGTLAAYARPQDEMIFYEINPLVIQLCDQNFSFIRSAKMDGATISIRQGDARLLIEQELRREGSHQFDILVVDAFSGDSIPVHLLTKECFEIYLAHLQNDGILAVHVSNRYIDLKPVVSHHAKRHQMQALFIDQNNDLSEMAATSSDWLVLTYNKEVISNLYSTSGVLQLKVDEFESIEEWTDDYNSLWLLLR